MRTHVTTGDITAIPPQVHRIPRRKLHCHRAAVAQAYAAAQLVVSGGARDIQTAAAACGVCAQYVSAVLAIVRSRNNDLLNRVLLGQLSPLTAARQVKTLATLVKAYRVADAATLAEFGKQVGVASLWDRAITPTL